MRWAERADAEADPLCSGSLGASSRRCWSPVLYPAPPTPQGPEIVGPGRS